MKFVSLKSKLKIRNDELSTTQVNITTATFAKNIKELLKYCYHNEPIVIDQAQLIAIDEDNQTIKIKGTSSFLKMPNLPVEVTFSIDPSEKVQLVLKYQLLGDMPGPNDWIFTRSFQHLPGVPDYNEPIIFNRTTQHIEQAMVVPLTALRLFNGYFIVVSEQQIEPEFKVPLVWGINFVSHLRPKGIVALIENLFQFTNQLTIYGSIRLPLPEETPQQLAAKYPASPVKFRYPWNVLEEFPKGLPGIFLQVDLGVNYSIAQDRINFKGEKFYIYTPINSDWVLPATNPAFIPMQAFVGKVDLPSAAISVEVVCPIDIGVHHLELVGFFDGIQLDNLSKLTSLTGTNKSPLAELPQEIQDVGDTIGQLELTGASISIDYSSLSQVAITNISFTVGMPALNLNVWEDHFEIKNISCYFEVDYPFSVGVNTSNERHLGVIVYGKMEIENIPFNVYSSKMEGFTFFAELAEKQTVPLKKILSKYAPEIPPPSDLNIDIFRIGIAPGDNYSMAFALAGQPNPWILPVGPKGLLVQDVSMGFIYPQGGPAIGSVSGTIALENFAELSVTYDTPGNVIIRSLLPDIQFRQLVGILTDIPLEIPADFDFQFTDSSILMQKQADDYTFQLGTHLDIFGSLGLQVQKINGQKWGMAFGMDMTAGKPSNLPGLSFLSNFEAIFPLNKFLLVVSSIEAPSFQFPDMVSFNNPRINTKNITLPSNNGLVAGLNIFAEWKIDTSDKQQKLLKDFLGLDPVMGVTLQVSKIPSEASKLFLSYQTQVQGHPLSCVFGGQIMDGSIGLFLTGSFIIDIQNQPQHFDVTLLFVTSGAFMSATMKGSTAIDFEVFQIANLALEVGINWSGIPSLGVTGTIAVSSFQSSIAVFFDSAEPSKSLVAGSVSDLSLKDVFDTFTGNAVETDLLDVLELFSVKGTREFEIDGQLSNDLDELQIEQVAAACKTAGALNIPTAQEQYLLIVNEKGKSWHLTDMTLMRHYALKKSGTKIKVSTEAQFYCAPQDTFIGSIRFPQAFYINCAINILEFHTAATIEINPHKGVAISTEMSKIIIGNELVFSLKAEQGEGGPLLSMATFKDAGRENPEFHDPHCYINGEITTLGLSKGAFVNITNNGAEFKLEGNLLPGVEMNLSGHFDSLTNLGIGGGIKIGIGEIDLGPLGKINIDTWAEAQLSMGVKGTVISAKIDLSFTLAGTTHQLIDFDLDIDTAALANIAKTVWDAIKKFFEDFFSDPEKWAEYLANGIVKGVDEAQQVLDDVFGLPPGKTKEIMNTYFPPCAVTSALGGL